MQLRTPVTKLQGSGVPVNVPVLNVAVPLLVTALLAYTSFYTVSLPQFAAAWLLCWMPWKAYRDWLRGKRQEIPLFAMLGACFWLAYAVPLFWGKHEVGGVFGRRILTETGVTDSMYLAVVGVGCLWLGMRAAARFHWVPVIGVDISDSAHHWNYLRLTVIVGMLVRTFVPDTAFGEGGRQIVSNFENIVPVVGFAIFARYYLRGKLVRFDKALILGFSLVVLVVGVSSGWLGSFLGVGVVCVVIYIYERRKFPVAAAFLVLPFILFFQPTKETFRGRYWNGKSTDSRMERVGFWVTNSWSLWAGVFSGQSDIQAKDLANATLGRLSLLQQTANVIEMTPSRVPYQHGSTYSYIAITFIPRFLWPDKPSVNDANRWYQVTYGLSRPESLSFVSISVGTLAESYINFGWFGPVLVMFFLGILLGSFQRIFLHVGSGQLFSSLGAVLVPHLLAIEGQMAEYLAGLAQQIALVLIVLVPTLKSRVRGNSFQPLTALPHPASSGMQPVQQARVAGGGQGAKS
jgi:hypothetical protein